MTSSSVAVTDAAVEPSAIASPVASAAVAVGEILKQLVLHSFGFHTENQTDAAISSIEKWVSGTVGSAINALDTSQIAASKEDVTLRVPPGGPAATVLAGPVLDYQKLAEAILAAQQAQAAKNAGPPPTNEVEPPSE
jgi:hypothetical protein